MAFIEADFARVLRDTGYLSLSAVIMERAFDTYRKIKSNGFNESHPKFASMLAINGLILRDLNRLDEAKENLLQAVELQKDMKCSKYLKAETLCTLGTVYDRLESKSESKKQFDESLNILEHVDVCHPLKSTMLIASGRLLCDMGDVDRGHDNLEKGLKLREQSCGYIHPKLAQCHRLLGLQHPIRVDPYHLKKAIDIYSQLIDREEDLCDKYKIPKIPVLEKWKYEVGNMKKLL